MNKPKELKGEVKKFENWVKENLAEGQMIGLIEPMIYLVKYVGDFYTQPFKPEMIEKYFEGWMVEKRTEAVRIRNDKYIILFNFTPMTKSHYLFYLNMSKKYLTEIPILTLSDFINACINSDIKLNWKSN